MQASFEILITANETQCFLSSLITNIKGFIPPLPLDSGVCVCVGEGGYTSMCHIKFYLYWKIFLEGEGDLVFLMKRDQREKRYFYKICRFLKKIKVNF